VIDCGPLKYQFRIDNIIRKYLCQNPFNSETVLPSTAITPKININVPSSPTVTLPNLMLQTVMLNVSPLRSYAGNASPAFRLNGLDPARPAGKYDLQNSNQNHFLKFSIHPLDYSCFSNNAYRIHTVVCVPKSDPFHAADCITFYKHSDKQYIA